MSPRPRETSDQQILEATARVMQHRSPTQLTLADVAKEAGVVPATLIQRFGTKRQASPRRLPDRAGQRAKAIRRCPCQISISAEGSRRALRRLLRLRPHPRSRSQRPRLSPDRSHRSRFPRHHPGAIPRHPHRNEEAPRRSRRRPRTPPLRHRRNSLVSSSRSNDGAMLSWAVYREGSLADWVRRDLQALLAPYRVANRRRPGPHHPKESTRHAGTFLVL